MKRHSLVKALSLIVMTTFVAILIVILVKNVLDTYPNSNSIASTQSMSSIQSTTSVFSISTTGSVGLNIINIELAKYDLTGNKTNELFEIFTLVDSEVTVQVEDGIALFYLEDQQILTISVLPEVNPIGINTDDITYTVVSSDNLGLVYRIEVNNKYAYTYFNQVTIAENCSPIEQIANFCSNSGIYSETTGEFFQVRCVSEIYSSLCDEVVESLKISSAT